MSNIGELKASYTRTRDQSHNESWGGLYTNHIVDKATGNVVTNDQVVRNYTVKQVDTMTDTATPGYAQRVSNGQVISSPMSKVSSVYTNTDTGFHLIGNQPTFLQNYTETKCSPFYWRHQSHAPHGIDIANLQALTQTKCLAGIKTSTLQGIVSLAESNKTLKMVLAPLQTILPALSYIRQLRKGNVNITIARNRGRKLLINGRDFGKPNYWHKGPGRLIKPPKGNFVIPAGQTVASSVLAFNLGLKPLMMDLEAFLRDIPKAHKEERNTYRAASSDSTTTSTQKVLSTYYFSVSASSQTKTRVSIRCSALVADRFDVLSDFGMSVNDMPEAAWELIPFSFVVDYFVNIGDVIGAGRALRQENILAFSTVTKIEQETVVTYGDMALKPDTSMTSIARPISGAETFTTVTKSRDVSLPQPTFAYNPQPFRPVVVQNLLSLLVLELKRHSGAKRTFS